MAKYILIEFDNDDQAHKMVEKIEGVESSTYRIAGIFKKPVKYCECPPRDAYVKTDFALGKAFGWWVHRQCRRPRRGTHSLVNILRLSERRWKRQVGFDARVMSLSIAEMPVQNIKLEEATDGVH